MAHPAGEAETGDLRVDFDRRLRLEFHGSRITSDAGLLAFRELDDALGLTGMAGDALADSRTGRNSRHSLMAQFRQSVFGRLAGYEDVNDADRLGVDPAMRWIVRWGVSRPRFWPKKPMSRRSPICQAGGSTWCMPAARPMSWCSTWTAA